jgi:hypothetical protein
VITIELSDREATVVATACLVMSQDEDAPPELIDVFDRIMNVSEASK